MIKLYGIPVSNYTNMVKVVLLEKGIEFEEVPTPPGDESLAARSPMGKIPCIEVDGKFVSETSAILDYLDDVAPTPPLYPADPLARAKVKEMVRVIELYLELALRRHYGAAFFGEDQNPTAVEEVKPVVEKALNSLAALGSFGPYLAGDEFSAADIYAYYTFGYGNMTAQAIYDWNIVDAVPGLNGALGAIGARETVKNVDEVQQAALAEFLAQQSS